MRESVAEYLKLVVRSWWARITVLAGLLGLVGEVTSLGIPRWIWWVVVGVAVVLAQFAAFRHVREERELLAASSAPGEDSAPEVVFMPHLFEGRLLPWSSYAVVDSNDEAFVIRGALAWAIDREPAALTSDLQKRFEDAVAESAFEGWLQREAGLHRAVPQEQWWRRVQPTTSKMITLTRSPASMHYHRFSIAGQCVLDAVPRLIATGVAQIVIIASAVIRPADAQETDSEPPPLSLNDLYEALTFIETALADQIGPKMLEGLAEEARPLGYAALAIANSGSLPQYVGLSFYDWPRAEGAYEPNALVGRAESEAAVFDLDSRAAQIKDWLKRFLSDTGYSDFEHDVDQLERSQLPVPIAT